MIKLNLGCGTHVGPPGFINVDKYPPADILCDLENPDDAYHHWPWEPDSVDEVIFYHSLEHMGKTPEGFFLIMKELYRACCADAKIVITVPHPRHDDFINDPTHVRIITPLILELFSKKNNEMWAKEGQPNTPLALQLGVDFEIADCSAHVEKDYHGLPESAIRDAMMKYNNVIKFMTITLKVIK